MIRSGPVRVLLLLQRPEAWINIESLWCFLMKSENFEPCIWVLPYNYEDKKKSQRKTGEFCDLLSASSIPFHLWDEGDLIADDQFDAVVINHPYDRERPSSLWSEKIQKVVPEIIYIPYGPIMGGGYKNLNLQFSQETQVRATAVIARCDHEKRMYEKYCRAGSEHVHVLGYPRFDQVLKRLQLPVPDHIQSFISGRVCILWNSHFSFGHYFSQSSNFSTFDLLGPEIFECAISMRKELCLLWRPHPGLMPAIIREGLLNESDIPILRSELSEAGILLDESSDHLPAFNSSDALITDVGSFLLEYLVTSKPLVALLNPEGEPLNEESECLVRHYRSVKEPSDIKGLLDDILSGNVEITNLEDVRNEHLPYLDGHSSERVAELIFSMCRNNDGSFSRLSGSGLIEEYSYNTFLGSDNVTRRGYIQECSLVDFPVFEKLVNGLKCIRDDKRKEFRIIKNNRRLVNRLRAYFVERIKRYSLAVRFFRRPG